MDHRLTDKARRVIAFARNAAQRAGMREISPECILLGVLQHDNCVASAILQHLNVPLDRYFEEHIQRQAEAADSTCQLPDEFIERALNESRELNHEYIGTEHLLLAVSRSASSASEHLRDAGIGHQMLREVAVRLLDKPEWIAKKQPLVHTHDSVGCHVTDLYEHPVHIPLVARWIHDEFWANKGVYTPDVIADLLRQATGPDRIPLSLLALVSGQPVATVNLIENDDSSRTHLHPWLAALFVVPEHRNCGIGSTLVRALQRRASAMSIRALYLGTDIPDFYQRFGATIHERVADGFHIMRLNSSTS